MIRIERQVQETITVPLKTLKRAIGAKRHGRLEVLAITQWSPNVARSNVDCVKWDNDSSQLAVVFTNHYTESRRRPSR